MKNIALSCIFTVFLSISLSVCAHINASQTELEALLQFHDPVTSHASLSQSRNKTLSFKEAETTAYHSETVTQVTHYPGLHDLGTLDTVLLLTGWRFISAPHLSQIPSTIGEYMKHQDKQTFSLLPSSDTTSGHRFANKQNPLDTLITVLTGLGLIGLGISFRSNRG